MLKKPLTLSIVIPAYNEERYLSACLDAIAVQTIKPDAVIVVDNNSTDRTAEIARDYPFVTLLCESRQGQVFAQAKAFDATRSDILARIDADTILPHTWVRQVKQQFTERPDAIALTGDAVPYDVYLRRTNVAVWHFYHRIVARLLAGQTMLWGSNCALRRSAWPGLKASMHFRADIWEDYDMSFQLARVGRILYVPQLKVGCSFRPAHKSLATQYCYQLRSVRTFYLNTTLARTILLCLLWHTMIILGPLALLDGTLGARKQRGRLKSAI